MRRTRRDTILMLLLFLGWIGLLATYIPPRRADFWIPGVWRSFAVLGIASIVILILNLWGIRRGTFRWHIEGVASLVTLILCGAIIFPVYASALMARAHARMDQARQQHDVPRAK